MGSNYLSPPAKRTVQDQTQPNGLTNKRSKPTPIPAGHVSFRILCHVSRVGGLIGKSGSIIKQLQQETGAKIRVEDAPNDCPDRVVMVTGPKGEGGGEVSKGQEALVRVFERVLEVEAEGSKAEEAGNVSCRMLAEASQVGAVIGKGGCVVEKIKKDCGVRVRVLGDNLPACAASSDEVIEIDGVVSAVKKALIAVSRCLQDSQTSDKKKTSVSTGKPVPAVLQVGLPEVHLNMAPQSTSLLPSTMNRSFNYVLGPPSLSSVGEQVVTQDSKSKAPEKEVIFRMLCSKEKVGSVIGKGGSIIKALQNETGASVTIGPTLTDCDERLITITAMENPEFRYSAAQKTVVLVFSRSVDAGSEKELDAGTTKGPTVTARLVISSNQVGCLLGKGGSVVSEMRKATRAGIQIINQVPKCAPENDHVVQVTGETQNVMDAVYHITGRLRDHLFSGTLTTIATRSNTSLLTETVSFGGLKDPLKEPLRDVVMDPIRDPLRSTLRGAARNPLIDPLGDVLRDPLRDTYRFPLRDALRDPRTALTEPLREVVRDPLPRNLASSVGLYRGLGRHTGLPQNMDHIGSYHTDRPSSRLWASQASNGINLMGISDVSRGSASSKGGLELGSGSKSAIVMNTTVEIIVPENAYGSVYGENGSNLARLRQVSTLCNMLLGTEYKKMGNLDPSHQPHLGKATYTNLRFSSQNNYVHVKATVQMQERTLLFLNIFLDDGIPNGIWCKICHFLFFYVISYYLFDHLFI